MYFYVCSTQPVAGVCNDPVWFEFAIPQLTYSDAAILGSAVALLWASAYVWRLFRRVV